MTAWRIVCDAGGTNVRYARADETGNVSDVITLTSSLSLEDALQNYAARFSDTSQLNGVAVAAAGPIENGCVRLTNRDLDISVASLSRALEGRPAVLLNDLEAAAWSLPVLDTTQLGSILWPTEALSGPRLVVNVGTGFGGAILVQVRGGWHVIACEPGHMTFVPRQADGLIATVEDAISGLTLSDPVRLKTYWNLPLDHLDFAREPLFAPRKPPEEVEQGLHRRADLQKFHEAFSAALGQVCGDLVLACGAWGGVYLCGSVASAWHAAGQFDEFQAAFEDKGPMTPRMRRVSVSMITHGNPVLIGLTQVPLR